MADEQIVSIEDAPAQNDPRVPAALGVLIVGVQVSDEDDQQVIVDEL